MPKREERIIIYQGHIHILPNCDDLENSTKIPENITENAEDKNKKSHFKNT